MIPRQGQGQRKWYKMVKVNGVNMHGRYEKKLLKSLGVFDAQDGWQKEHDSYDTHMDQKGNTKHRDKPTRPANGCSMDCVLF